MFKVITLHGIRTRGEWQKTLVSPLIDGGFHPIPLDYGYFTSLQLLMPWTRRRKVEWFRNQYQSLIKPGDPPPHLIAHSFGSYIAAEAMRKHSEIRFGRVIICGSIIERGFPWQIAFSRGQVTCVLNETGGRDVPAAIVGWAVEDAGSSGRDGFKGSHPCLIESPNPHDAHSDAFYTARAQQRWVPFLHGEPPVETLQMPAPTPNRRPLATAALVLLASSALVWFAWRAELPTWLTENFAAVSTSPNDELKDESPTSTRNPHPQPANTADVKAEAGNENPSAVSQTNVDPKPTLPEFVFNATPGVVNYLGEGPSIVMAPKLINVGAEAFSTSMECYVQATISLWHIEQNTRVSEPLSYSMPCGMPPPDGWQVSYDPNELRLPYLSSELDRAAQVLPQILGIPDKKQMQVEVSGVVKLTYDSGLGTSHVRYLYISASVFPHDDSAFVATLDKSTYVGQPDAIPYMSQISSAEFDKGKSSDRSSVKAWPCTMHLPPLDCAKKLSVDLEANGSLHWMSEG